MEAKLADGKQNLVSTHSRLKAAGTMTKLQEAPDKVSTHSRLKAAGHRRILGPPTHRRFNTQPPEGGWIHDGGSRTITGSFNTQPPEGGWK